MAQEGEVDEELKVLVFSTETISDPGIDFAGSAHIPYAPAALVVTLPCSSGIRPEWILYALQEGFDGVFIAADGTDCAYLPDCTARTGKVVSRAQALLKANQYDPKRLKMAAICSVCAESFVKHVGDFTRQLGTLRSEEEACVTGG
jgi:coenzyme F420-reducing hydrogenase delta subunit